MSDSLQLDVTFQQKIWNDWLELWRLSNKPRQLGVLVDNEAVNLYTKNLECFETPVLPPLVIICDTNE